MGLLNVASMLPRVPCNSKFAKHGGMCANQEGTRMSEIRHQHGKSIPSFGRTPRMASRKPILSIRKGDVYTQFDFYATMTVTDF